MGAFRKVEDSWQLTETTRLTGLTLTETGSITAPAGKLVTLVFNGENLPLLPGQYEGDIVLEVTDVLQYQDLDFRAAVVLENGSYVPEKSVRAAAVGGSVSDGLVSGISVTSYEEAVNGIFASVPEGGETVIEDVTLNMTGNGGSDFAGWGAAIAGCGKGKLTVNRADITTHGAARGAIYAGENIKLEVNDSKIHTKGGVLNADYVDTIKVTPPGVMRRVPWMLGLRGNCRATNLLDYAEAVYNRCDITADGWGVLSTDGVKRCRMQINDSSVEITGQSGYGALSIGDCVVEFHNSTVKAGDYGMIMMMGQGSGGFKDGTVVHSRRFATMSDGNSGLVEVDGSSLLTDETTFVVKGCSTEFRVHNSELKPANGIILQVMDSDDPFNPTGYYTDPEGPDVPVEGRDLTAAAAGTDVIAHFSDMELTGDLFNGSSALSGDTGGVSLMGGPPPADLPAAPEGGMPPFPGDMPAAPGGAMPPFPGDMPAAPGGDMPPMDMPAFGGASAENLAVTLQNAVLTGRITASVSRHRVPRVDKENCEELGEVINTPAPAVNNGVIVRLEAGSTWNVTDVCYLTSLTIAAGAALHAGSLLVDGVERPIAPGTYTGAIEVRP